MFKFTVLPDNGKPYDVVATSRDVRVWEKQHKDNSLSKFSQDLKLDDLYSVAYIASVRQGLYSGTQEEFDKSVDLEMSVEEDESPKA
jgi:hypothetical protein